MIEPRMHAETGHGPTESWDEFISWVKRFTTWEEYDSEERDYKINIANRLERAREALYEEEQGWLDLLRSAFGPPNNLTSWRVHAKFLEWCRDHPEQAKVALRAIWNPSSSVIERFDAFLASVNRAVEIRIAEASFLHMAMGATQYPIFRARSVSKAMALVGYPKPLPAIASRPGSRYDFYLGFLDRIMEEASSRGVSLRDRLDAQSICWSITEGDPVGLWSNEERNAFFTYRGDTNDAGAAESEKPLPTDTAPSPISDGSRDPVIAATRINDDEHAADARHEVSAPAVWWVNQGQTYIEERNGGYLWAPKHGKSGSTYSHWSIMTQVQEGDFILHYANTALRAVSVVESKAVDAARPSGLAQGHWDQDGWLIKTAYHEFAEPIALKEIPSTWRPAGTGSPFTKDGNVTQGYLYAAPADLLPRLIGRFPDRWPDDVRKAKGNTETRLFKIAAGKDAAYWEDCLTGGFICIGWDETGDLRQYVSKDAFMDAFRHHYDAEYNGASAKITEKAGEVWTFGNLQPGDRVIANRGKSTVLAVGEVKPPGYEWRPDREGFRHIVHVAWDTSKAGQIPEQPRWAFKTVLQLPNDFLQILHARPLQNHDYIAPDFSDIVDRVRDQGLRIGERTLRRYHLSLQTRGFVILAGVSGTGKTWLAEAYAQSVGARHALVSVAPNWTTNEDLLGYYNPITGAYQDTIFSRFLREASEENAAAISEERAPQPFHLVLDEMNLARVEYYFASFLSAMEVRQRHGESVLQLGGGYAISLSPNLAVIGTVNVDETTHGFADKVYDRAQLVELDLSREDVAAHLGDAPYRDDLLAIWDAVTEVGPFAFRVLDEIGAYVNAAAATGIPWEDALDEQILQKVLPRLKGADAAIGNTLETLVNLTAERYPMSNERSTLMLERFRNYEFASYFS